MVLTYLGSVKATSFYCEHENLFLVGELEISLWSLGGHDMTLTWWMSPFSHPA